ncbi:MAG: sigma-70 family RNA polymerase sigma factor [Anaerolineae bacterium]|nr:sigma-70 family RNA polymerase sigma factor [Anaerolineae bacterium]
MQEQVTDRSRLRQFIERESNALLGTLRMYLVRAGLERHSQPLDAAAAELLNEVVCEALRHEHRFRPSGQPRAWLLGIAANLIRRWQAESFRRERREPLVRDLAPQVEEAFSEDELFDHLAALAESGAVNGPEGDGEMLALLDALAPDDARVIRLAILNGLNGEALAAELGVTPGAARVRLHRALKRLRAQIEAEPAEKER